MPHIDEIKETIKAPLDYALIEVKDPTVKQNPYFKGEICALERMLSRAIVFMLEEGTGKKTNGEVMDANIREMIVFFIDEMLKIDFTD